ncbi:MAG: alanyl-tRNA editing protein [Promethearchaeia archaeon]
MTEMLHMKDNYAREFDAEVEKITKDSVVLDRTAFYPEGGGQVGDSGVLLIGDKEFRVKQAKKKGQTVYHTVDSVEGIEVGDDVHGIIDWDHRFRCMRFHTAQHILSRYLQKNYGLETAGSMIKPDHGRADYQPIDDFGNDMKAQVEDGVNSIIQKGIDVEMRFMPREEAIEFLESRGYQTRYIQMVPDFVKIFRIIVIGDYDAASCAGTHVRNTREIGGIEITENKNMGSEKQRIYFGLREH